MDQQFQTSFIPKKPVTEARAPVSRGSSSFFGILATIIFVIALILLGGSYFYRITVINDRDTIDASIKSKIKTFDADFLREVSTLDKRINAANEVLKQHTMVSPIFTKLEQLSLKTIQFTKFELSPASSGSASINVKMAGRAVNYAAIASESDVLAGVGSSKNTYFINPIFSNLNLDDKARVSFDLTFSVDPELVSYEAHIKRLNSDPTIEQ
ncbi:MAG TPA: hypothetical protein PK950_02175 [Candidatus Paceibacterota bacterium]|nr:hypothetical protein [Candidatus Paceibacterota bacterium]